MWRPDGWDKAMAKWHKKQCDAGECLCAAREDGADVILEALAKQVGPNPCDTCALVTILEHRPKCITSNPCPKASFYLGQQSGYAKGIQEGRKHE